MATGSCDQRSSVLSPVRSYRANHDAIPPSPGIQQAIPVSFSRYMNPGMVLEGRGDCGCAIKEDRIPSESNCKIGCDFVKAEVERAGAEERYYTDIGLREKGYQMFLPDYFPDEVNVGMNPKKEFNYQQAIVFVNEHFLKPDYFDSKVRTIIGGIKGIHEKLTRGLPDPYCVPGKYRTAPVYIFREYMLDRSLEGLTEVFLERGGSEEEVAEFSSAYRKLKSVKSDADIQSLTDGERAAFEKVAYIAPLGGKH